MIVIQKTITQTWVSRVFCLSQKIALIEKLISNEKTLFAIFSSLHCKGASSLVKHFNESTKQPRQQHGLGILQGVTYFSEYSDFWVFSTSIIQIWVQCVMHGWCYAELLLLSSSPGKKYSLLVATRLCRSFVSYDDHNPNNNYSIVSKVFHLSQNNWKDPFCNFPLITLERSFFIGEMI